MLKYSKNYAQINLVWAEHILKRHQSWPELDGFDYKVKPLDSGHPCFRVKIVCQAN